MDLKAAPAAQEEESPKRPMTARERLISVGWAGFAEQIHAACDEPKAQLPTGNFRYLREVILSAM